MDRCVDVGWCTTVKVYLYPSFIFISGNLLSTAENVNGSDQSGQVKFKPFLCWSYCSADADSHNLRTAELHNITPWPKIAATFRGQRNAVDVNTAKSHSNSMKTMTTTSSISEALSQWSATIDRSYVCIYTWLCSRQKPIPCKVLFGNGNAHNPPLHQSPTFPNASPKASNGLFSNRNGGEQTKQKINRRK